MWLFLQGSDQFGRFYRWDGDLILMTDIPLACSIDSQETHSRARELLPGLVARARERADLPTGLRWTFASTDGLLAEIGKVIETERKCCPFMRFMVVVEPDGGQVSLEVTGPTGIREFLERLLDVPTNRTDVVPLTDPKRQ